MIEMSALTLTHSVTNCAIRNSPFSTARCGLLLAGCGETRFKLETRRLISVEARPR
jgi:hypothetical protein